MTRPSGLIRRFSKPLAGRVGLGKGVLEGVSRVDRVGSRGFQNITDRGRVSLPARIDLVLGPVKNPGKNASAPTVACGKREQVVPR